MRKTKPDRIPRQTDRELGTDVYLLTDCLKSPSLHHINFISKFKQQRNISNQYILFILYLLRVFFFLCLLSLSLFHSTFFPFFLFSLRFFPIFSFFFLYVRVFRNFSFDPRAPHHGSGVTQAVMRLCQERGEEGNGGNIGV